MQLTFAAHREDAIACNALQILGRYGGHSTFVVDSDSPVTATTICLIGVAELSRNRYIRMGVHRMQREGIQIPDWAKLSPFVVAINGNPKPSYKGFRQSLDDMAAGYRQWGPWMSQPEAPWNPSWHRGAHEQFGAWHAQALAVVDANAQERLRYRVEPVFSPSEGASITRLIVTGCALFNAPHTDVVDTIDLKKRKAILQSLSNIVRDSGVVHVQFIVPRGDLVSLGLSDHLHEFMFMSIAEVNKYLPRAVSEDSRLLGASHAHARSHGEVAVALDRSGDGLERDIVQPLSLLTGIDVVASTWTEYLGAYMRKATLIAHEYRKTAEEIYKQRVATRPSYASLHRINPARGLQRTIANNIFYIAEAMYLMDNPNTAIINCEFEETFWHHLEGVLEKEVWGKYRPFIGMVPKPVRQPWGY